MHIIETSDEGGVIAIGDVVGINGNIKTIEEVG
jgi:hypothetical protein